MVICFVLLSLVAEPEDLPEPVGPPMGCWRLEALLAVALAVAVAVAVLGIPRSGSI